MKKYTVEVSATGFYDGLEYDHKPTADELDEFIDLFIDSLQSGYIDIDINCYEEEDE